MFSILETAKATAPAAQPAAAGAESGGAGMGGMGAMLGGASKGGFTGGTAKDKQMNSLMNWFTDSMNSMFGGMAPKASNGTTLATKK